MRPAKTQKGAEFRAVAARRGPIFGLTRGPATAAGSGASGRVRGGSGRVHLRRGGRTASTHFRAKVTAATIQITSQGRPLPN